VQYRERPNTPVITYHLEIDEISKGPVVAREWMRWKRGRYGAPFHFLNYEYGEGEVISGEAPEAKDTRVHFPLTSPEVLAVNTLGQLAANPRVEALRDFIVGWHLSYLSAAATRGNPEAGAQEKLSQTGDNLPNVIQYLREQHPDRLDHIFSVLRQRVPRLESFDAEILTDGRLLLTLKDAPFDEPVLARYASDGTMKLLAYLIHTIQTLHRSLESKNPKTFCIQGYCLNLQRSANLRRTERNSSSPPIHRSSLIRSDRKKVRVIYRDESGYSRIKRVADMPGIQEFLQAGASLGDLWMEGHFSVGDPLKT
jgi:hypothetical protein